MAPDVPKMLLAEMLKTLDILAEMLKISKSGVPLDIQ